MALKGQGPITLDGDQFINENGQPFFPMVMNYYTSYAFPAGHPPAGGHYPSATEIAADVHLEHPSFFGLTGAYPDPDITHGPQQILHALYEIKFSGFNTIRLVMTPIKRPGLGFKLELKDYGSAQNDHDADIYIDPPYDPAVNAAAAFHFNSVLEVCNLANVVGLKVLLITADSPSNFPDLINGNAGDPQIEDYANFLGELARFIHAHHVYNLLGYDLYGEPGLAELGHLKGSSQGMHTRSQICEIVNTWTSAIRAYDDHLITVGNYPGEGPFQGGWDPLLMDIDFSTIHLYPAPERFEYDTDPATYVQKFTRRYGDMMYHVDQTLNKPYMIAETGFIAHDHVTPADGISYPISVFGNEADENYFIEQTFPSIRNSRAAGYGWWLFQDTHFEPPPDPNIEHMDGDFFGLLNFCDPGPLDVAGGISGYEACRKDAAWTFADYAVNPPTSSPTVFGPASPTVDMSDPYYNPYDHPVNATVAVLPAGATYYGTLNGHVQDESGAPIVGAYIIGTCEVGHDANAVMQYHSTYTFTDENGDFTLRGYDTVPDDGTPSSNGTPPPHQNRDQCIMDLKIGTYGAGWLQYGDWDDSDPIQQDQTYVMHTASQLFDGDLDGITIGLTENQSFEATNSLTAHQFVVEGDGVSQGGASVLKATYKVQLKPGFHAEKGSDVHVYTDRVHIDCGAVQAGDLRSMGTTDDGGMLPSNKQERSIGLVLHQDPDTESFQVIPNPTDGLLNLDWSCAGCTPEKVAQLTITNAVGMVIFQGSVKLGTSELDLRPIASGTYNVSIQFQNKVRTRRIIIQ
jgi:hypothetical protein